MKRKKRFRKLLNRQAEFSVCGVGGLICVKKRLRAANLELRLVSDPTNVWQGVIRNLTPLHKHGSDRLHVLPDTLPFFIILIGASEHGAVPGHFEQQFPSQVGLADTVVGETHSDKIQYFTRATGFQLQAL